MVCGDCDCENRMFLLVKVVAADALSCLPLVESAWVGDRFHALS